jgi:1-acyl-sn-glycerol-3-phosphate acyltransferase
LFVALGAARDGPARRWLGCIPARPVRRLASLAMQFDGRVGEDGAAAGCRWLLSHFVERVEAVSPEHIPLTGPVLIAANHPGAYDSFALIASLPRPNIKVLSSEVTVFRYLPNVAGHLIQTDRDPYKRLAAVRAAVSHLQAGGCLVTFASGFLDPDPLAYDGAAEEARAALADWSPSLELLLRKASETQLVPAIVGGVVAPQWARHPLVRHRRRPHDRRKLAEFLQVIYQLVRPGRLRLTPRVVFGEAVPASELAPGTPECMPRILARAEATLDGLQTEDLWLATRISRPQPEVIQ